MSRGIVLVMEDDPLSAKLTRTLLGLCGLEAEIVATAEEGLALSKALRPVLVIMDLRLPGLDGLTAISRLRSDAETSAIPVAVVTAQATPGEQERAVAAGCQAFLTKPIDTRRFVETVNALTARGWSGE
ncbi:MAG: response regulator [Firmicutes bacterium]|nr:response regulator [Bacillota bacterium]MCL5039258.1 response regulator [Bacillota bacterium]